MQSKRRPAGKPRKRWIGKMLQNLLGIQCLWRVPTDKQKWRRKLNESKARFGLYCAVGKKKNQYRKKARESVMHISFIAKVCDTVHSLEAPMKIDIGSVCYKTNTQLFFHIPVCNRFIQTNLSKGKRAVVKRSSKILRLFRTTKGWTRGFCQDHRRMKGKKRGNTSWDEGTYVAQNQ